jgi:hypothetical protein
MVMVNSIVCVVEMLFLWCCVYIVKYVKVIESISHTLSAEQHNNSPSFITMKP